MQYTLRKNPLRTHRQEYVAQVRSPVRYDFDRIMEDLSREGSILREARTRAVIHEFFRQLGRLLSRGIGFRSEHFTLSPGLRGTFASLEDEFDPARHTLVLSMRPGKELKKALSAVKPVKART